MEKENPARKKLGKSNLERKELVFKRRETFFFTSLAW
jgi:hypothetical protein